MECMVNFKMQKGFTIIECLISILLLAIVMVGGMAFYFNSTGHLTAATHRRIAAELANARLEAIKNNGYAVLPPQPLGPPLGIWLGPTDITIGGLTGQQEVYVFDVENYKEVRVRIYWNEANAVGLQEVILDTYIAPR